MMASSHSERDDPIWRDAWAWVMREHEQPLDARGRQALTVWLTASELHRQAYEQASSLWLVAGLVPAAHIDLPDATDDERSPSKP